MWLGLKFDLTQNIDTKNIVLFLMEQYILGIYRTEI